MTSPFDDAEAKRHIALLKLVSPFTLEDVVEARRENARRSHPDRFQAEGGDALLRAQKRMAMVNAACDYLEAHFASLSYTWSVRSSYPSAVQSASHAPDATRYAAPEPTPLWKKRAKPRSGRKVWQERKVWEEWWAGQGEPEAAPSKPTCPPEVKPESQPERPLSASGPSASQEAEWKRRENDLARREHDLSRREKEMSGREAEAAFFVSEARKRAKESERAAHEAEHRAQEAVHQQERSVRIVQEMTDRAEADLKLREASLQEKHDLLACAEDRSKRREAQLLHRQDELEQREATLKRQRNALQRLEAVFLQRDAALALREAAAEEKSQRECAALPPVKTAAVHRTSLIAPTPYDYRLYARQQRLEAGLCPDCGKPLAEWWDARQNRCGNCGSSARAAEPPAGHMAR